MIRIDRRVLRRVAHFLKGLASRGWHRRRRAGIPIQLSSRWQLAARGDIGGFGVDSDLVWNIVFGVDHALSSTFAVQFGYRIMRVELSSNVGMGEQEVMMQTTTHGPGFAASARF